MPGTTNTRRCAAALLLSGAITLGMGQVASAGWNDAGENTIFEPNHGISQGDAVDQSTRYTYEDGSPVEAQPAQRAQAQAAHTVRHHMASSRYAEPVSHSRQALAKGHDPLVRHALHSGPQESSHS